MQGVVYWQPPESATNKIERIIREPVVSRYGSDDGLLEHREALLEKDKFFICQLRNENKIHLRVFWKFGRKNHDARSCKLSLQFCLSNNKKNHEIIWVLCNAISLIISCCIVIFRNYSTVSSPLVLIFL